MQPQQQLQQFHTVRLILGDQLNAQHSWFNRVDDQVLYVIAELHQENTYVTHHVQKICAFCAAMAQFAQELRAQGHQVLYLTLDDTFNNTQGYSDLLGLIQHQVTQVGAIKFEYQRPDEYRLLEQLSQLKLNTAVVNCVDTEHFILPFDEIDTQFPVGKHIMMEHFYRRMRKRFNILMQEGKPLGGQWNFDASNRQKLKTQDIKVLPAPLMFSLDVTEILARLERHQIPTMGRMDAPLLWPINRAQSLELLTYFCQLCLPSFGRFQDAMTAQHHAKWSLYHSRQYRRRQTMPCRECWAFQPIRWHQHTRLNTTHRLDLARFRLINRNCQSPLNAEYDGRRQNLMIGITLVACSSS